MIQQRVQAWFMGLSLTAKVVIIGIVAAAFFVFRAASEADIRPKDVLRWLPVAGVLIGVAGAGGFLAWRWWENYQIARQVAINRQLAGQGVARLILPARALTRNWKEVAAQAEAFATFLSTALEQFPDSHIALEIIGSERGIILQVWCPKDALLVVLQGLVASFPYAQVRNPQDVIKSPDALAGLSGSTQWVLLGLAQKAHFPLQQTSELANDSLATVLAALVRSPAMGRVGMQLILKNPGRAWSEQGQQEVERRRAALAQIKGAGAIRPGDKQLIEALGRKSDALTGLAATVIVFAEPTSADRLKRLIMAVTGVSRSRYNSLRVVAQGQGAERVVGRHFDRKAGLATVLSADELGTLWHVPQQEGSDIITARGAYLPPPPEVVTTSRPPFSPDHRVLGKGLMRTGDEVFVIWPYGGKDKFDSLVHMAIIGATGSGKSTQISNLVLQDICFGGCSDVVIEPHRNLTLGIIAGAPRDREQDIIWINPSDPYRTFGLNPLDYGGNPRYRAAVGGAFVAALQKIVGGDFDTAPRMKRILESTVEAVLDGIEQPTILHLVTFLRHAEYRKQVIDRVRNPEVKAFWETEFPGMSKQADALQPIFTRLSPLLVRDMTRQILIQPRTTLPMRALMDACKIILVDVSAKNPEVGDANAAALGTLLVNAIWSAASSRVKNSFRVPCYLWIDEFHLFVTRDIEKMLAEARGFGLGVYVATQYYGQLPDWMRDAILNNVWTKLVGRTNGPDEAKLAARIFTSVSDTQILTLPSFTYIAQVTADKQPTDSFTVVTFPPLPSDRLRQAYAQADDKLPSPESYGALPCDFFAGVAPMDTGERQTWKRHQEAMSNKDFRGQAEYLAALPDDDWQEYRALRRKSDLEQYYAILNDPNLEPDVEMAPDEVKGLDPHAVRRIRRIRRLSSLQIEVPRVEVVAEDLKLAAMIQAEVTSFDDFSFELLAP